MQQMNNSLQHIGLQVLEEDLQSFYKDILNCETKRSFTLSAEEAFPIFGIKQEVTIYFVACGDIGLELFVGEKIHTPTFGHICFQSNKAEEINNKAKAKGFRTYTRKRNSNATYFISDNNNNLFEIKKITE